MPISINMSPRLANNDHANGWPRDPIVTSNINHCDAAVGMSSADGSDIVIGKSRVGVGLASGDAFGARSASTAIPSCHVFGLCVPTSFLATCISALSMAIGNVIKMRSQKEMGGIATRAVVAAMQDEETVRDRTKGKNIAHAMGSPSLTPNTNSPVLVSVLTPCPRPARIGAARAVNARPKTFNLFRGKMQGHRALLTLGAVPQAAFHAALGFLLFYPISFRYSALGVS